MSARGSVYSSCGCRYPAADWEQVPAARHGSRYLSLKLPAGLTGGTARVHHPRVCHIAINGYDAVMAPRTARLVRWSATRKTGPEIKLPIAPFTVTVKSNRKEGIVR